MMPGHDLVFKRPKIKLTKVVLPDPEGPTMATRWPAGICKLNAEKLNFSLLEYLKLTSFTTIFGTKPDETISSFFKIFSAGVSSSFCNK